MLNTVVLLSSGVTVTWCHHSLVNGTYCEGVVSLFLTVLLGGYFTLLQAGEYIETRFSISDRVYGSSFFVATGFHGLHVLIGRVFLLVCMGRYIINQFSRAHHLGFEAAA